MANNESQESLFKRLTRLFRSGPVVKRKIRTTDTTIAVPDRTKSSGALLFQKSLSPTYATITSNAYNLSERLMRYQDFQEMEYTPELAAAMDIYADETVASDDKGKVLHVYSDNPKIKQILDDLFYNTLNVEFNLRSWARNLCKFGDFFLYNDVSPQHGVINAFPIPVNEIEREENYDRADPAAVRFRWVTLGNRVLENWEISHFRLLGNDMFLPYGSSIIEPARRIWRQLILIEDAMLVYRVVRAPERRVFYIDVGGMPAEAISPYVEEQKRTLKSSQVVDRTTGRVDLRYNPLSVDEDYFLPVRGGESGTKIETLAGGQNAAAVEDVQYIQKKLFAALKIPRAYLGYDEMLSSKATLAQEDIRFSRTINVIQKTIIAELNKLATIHLYANGFDSDDLVNFSLKLSNPSTIAQQQKLELWRAKFEIASAGLGEGMTSKHFVRKEILGLNDDQIDEIDAQRYDEKIVEGMIEGAKPEDEGGDKGEEKGGEEAGGLEDIFGTGSEDKEKDKDEEKKEKPENAGEPDEGAIDLLTANDDLGDEGIQLSVRDKKKHPVKVSKHLKKYAYNRSRQRKQGSGDKISDLVNPDFSRMVSDMSSLNDPGDSSWFKSYVSNPMGEGNNNNHKRSLAPDIIKTLNKMSDKLGRNNEISSRLLSEDESLELDLLNEEKV
jgi:hypothetical protein